MPEPLIETKVYLKTFAALLVLLLLTVGAAYLPLGRFNFIVSMAIAVAKALLIVLFFMQIRWSSRLLHFAAFAAIVWLAILLSGTLTDYATRHLVPLPASRDGGASPYPIHRLHGEWNS